MSNLLAFVLIVWAPDGHANAHPQAGALTPPMCIARMIDYINAHPDVGEHGPVPACVPDSVDF